MRRCLLVSLSLLYVVACREMDTTGPDGGPAAQGASSPSSPRILSLTASPLPLKQPGPTVVSAVVTDPQGISTLAGGTLADKSGHTLGVFSTPGGQGTFSFALTWDALAKDGQLTFGPDGGTAALTATFYDSDGNTVSQELDVPTECNVAGSLAVNGRCVPSCVTDSDCSGWATGYARGSYVSCQSGFPLCQRD